MSCSICQTKFTFFAKEHGCPNCGFSCCSKCLKYKHNLPNVGIKKICGPCHNKLQSTRKMNSDTVSPISDMPDEPLALVDITKKLDSLENPTKPPIVMYKHSNHWDKLSAGMEPADKEIVDRLRKLKGEDKNVPAPSVEEIKRRLALLKDQDPDGNKINIHQVDIRTNQQKTDDLIKEYLERLQLSSGSKSCDIEERLRSLRDEDAKAHSSSRQNYNNDEDDDDDEAITKKLIKKALAEAVLEAKYGTVDEHEEEMESSSASCDDDEKPKCVMCDKTTDLRRYSTIDDDLYCPACFEDLHD